ncbi:MAG: pirin family protein [Planctomycetota bacterium]
MITLRKASERGHANHGWLDTYHTFSFADYHDPAHMGFSVLRVINEDVVQPGQGFGTHPHRDMEIVTVVLAGALEHKDSLGTGSVIRPGDVQRMSAGTGVLHSEFNHSAQEPVHLLQIWILPERRAIRPGYEQKHFPAEARQDRLALVASRDARDGSLTIHQDASVYVGTLGAGVSVEHELAPGRRAWVHVATGTAQVNGRDVAAGDGVAVSGEPRVTITARDGVEVVLFDLP